MTTGHLVLDGLQERVNIGASLGNLASNAALAIQAMADRDVATIQRLEQHVALLMQIAGITSITPVVNQATGQAVASGNSVNFSASADTSAKGVAVG